MGRQSRDVMLALKNGRLIGSPPVPVWDAMASLIKQSVSRLGPLASFLSPTAVLVPVPKSALLQEGSLWVPDHLASSMTRVGLGRRASQLLIRTEAIPKAATSISSKRPRAAKHYQTLAIQRDLGQIPEIVLVDDVVTTGASLLGSANRLLESYPDVPIRGFAAIRTISNPSEFRTITDPVRGWITLRSDGLCSRRP